MRPWHRKRSAWFTDNINNLQSDNKNKWFYFNGIQTFYVNVKKLVRSSNGVARGNGFFAFDNFFNLFQQCPEETNFRLYYPRVNFNVWRLSSYHRLTLKHFTDYFTNQYLSIHGRPSWADFNTLINDLTQRSKCILVALKVWRQFFIIKLFADLIESTFCALFKYYN